MEKNVKRLFLLFICQHMLVYAFLDPVDFLSLQLIRKALDDMPGSTFFSSWDFTSDPCNFSGVLCKNDKVIALNFGDPRAGSPGLTGSLNPMIGNLSELVNVTVIPGQIKGAIPEAISFCRKLQVLILSRNVLDGEIPTSFSDLELLQTLDLSHNRLSGSIPPSLSKIPSLSTLIICHNRLSGSIPAFHNNKMIHLDLKHNNLSGPIPPNSLPSSLQYLSLSSNRLNGTVDGFLNPLENLNNLDLSQNRLVGNIPICIFAFPIQSLQLRRNQFSGTVSPSNFVTITTVDLSHNQLSGKISPLFSMVTNLYLNHNMFAGQVPDTVVVRLLSAGFHLLYLHHNYLTRIRLSRSTSIPNSTLMCLNYNCMLPPSQSQCPSNVGKQKMRPAAECMERRG